MRYASKLAVVVAGLMFGVSASNSQAHDSWGIEYVGHGHHHHCHVPPHCDAHHAPHYSYYRSYYSAPNYYRYSGYGGYGGYGGCYAPSRVYVAPPNHGGFGIQGRNASFWMNF